MINSLKKLFQGGGTDSAGRYGATGGYEGGITRRLDLAGAAAESDVRVKVIGVGGAGGNAVARMAGRCGEWSSLP